jgi:hypothetical protein
MAQEESTRSKRGFSQAPPALLPTPLPPPLCSVFMESLVPSDLACFVPKVAVVLNETALSAITREVYWFVLARHLAPAVRHFCLSRNMPVVSPSEFAHIEHTNLLIRVLSNKSLCWYKGPTAPLVFDVTCALELASSPWTAPRVGFFVAFTIPYRCSDIRHSVASLLGRIESHARCV